MKYSINKQRKRDELQNKLYQCMPGFAWITSLVVSLFFENRSNTLYTGRNFWCFVEFFVCEYAGCSQPATGKRFEWRICTPIG